MMRRQILSLQAKALVEARGADDDAEAQLLAWGLTDGLPVGEAAVLADDLAGYLVAIRLAADLEWDCDPRPGARALLSKIETRHQDVVAEAKREVSHRLTPPRTIGSVIPLSRGPEDG